MIFGILKIMLSNIINNLITDLKPRQQDVLIGRFGLDDGEKKTLASIGEKYNITRERVRQLEAEALNAVHNRLDGIEKSINQIKELIAGHLGNIGGLQRDDLIIPELKHILKDDNLHHWYLRFFSEVVGEPLYYPVNDNFHHFWYLDKKSFQFADRFISDLENLIADKKEEIIVHGRFNDYFVKIAKIHRLPHHVGLNYLSASKKFGINHLGDFGLSHWKEISPKTAKDKTYLILKKHKKPMHFMEIANAINNTGFSSKKALPQTIHNELIKDKRFVLVGRGIYGLMEHGFKSGVASDVIRAVLKEKGPLGLKNIVDEVLKQRLLKENTIILNLNNKKLFKKLADGRYTVK